MLTKQILQIGKNACKNAKQWKAVKLLQYLQGVGEWVSRTIIFQCF